MNAPRVRASFSHGSYDIVAYGDTAEAAIKTIRERLEAHHGLDSVPAEYRYWTDSDNYATEEVTADGVVAWN